MLVLCFISEASEKSEVTLPHWRCNDIVTCSSFQRHDRTKKLEASLEHWQYRYTALYHIWDLRNHTYPRNIWHAIILLPSYGYPVCVCNHIQPWRKPERCPALNMVRLCCVCCFLQRCRRHEYPCSIANTSYDMIVHCICEALEGTTCPTSSMHDIALISVVSESLEEPRIPPSQWTCYNVLCVCRESRGGERTVNHLEHEKHIGLIVLVIVSEALKERCTSPGQLQCNHRTTSLIIAEFMGGSSIPLEHLPSKYVVVLIVAKALEEPWIALAPMMQWKPKTVGILEASGTPNMRGVDCGCYLVMENHSNYKPRRCDIACLWCPSLLSR